MIGDIHISAGRRHDSLVLANSRLEARLRLAQQGLVTKHKAYADRAYITSDVIWAAHSGNNLALWQLVENHVMKRHRIGGEWGFGKMVNISAYLAFEKDLKVFLHSVSRYLVVGALISSTHTMLYGSIATTYWGVPPPVLEQYFA